MVTPNQAEYYKGLWRAEKQGRSHLPWWDDLSVNWVCLAFLAGIVLTAGTIAWSFPGEFLSSAASSFYADQVPGSFPLALATGVLVVAYFGLAFQYFQLRFAGRGKMYFALFLFVAWLLPLVGGSIQAASWGPTTSGEADICSSPSARSPESGWLHSTAIRNWPTAIQSAAITPALLFTFVFNYLLIGARKRVIRAVYLAAANRKLARDDETSLVPNLDGRIGLEPSSEEPGS